LKSWPACCFFLLLLVCGAEADGTQPLRLVGDSWPPFTDKRLPGNGAAVELVATALSRAGYPSEYHEVPWNRAILGLRRANYDVLVDSWFSDERSEWGHYSQPYLINRIRLVQRKGADFTFTQLSDLYPYRIAVMRGYAYSGAFNADKNLQTIAVSSFESAAHMLQLGRVDLAVEDEYVARFQFSEQLKDIADQLEFLPVPLSENELHILIRLSHGQHAEIAKRFDAAIAAMRADGSYAAIMARHGL